MLGTPGRIRTYDLWLRKPTLYPAELRVHVAAVEKLMLDRAQTLDYLCRLRQRS